MILESSIKKSNCNPDMDFRDNRFLEVAVPLPVFNTFTYKYNKEYSKKLRIGMRVLVPFGRRRLTGYIVGFHGNEPKTGLEIRDILDVLDSEPLFGEDDLKFFKWTSNYYYHPIGQTIKTALPHGLNTEYRYAASITVKGKSLLAKKSGDIRGIHVLQELADGREIFLKNLEKKTGGDGFNINIDYLKETRLIDISLKKGGSEVRIRKEKWFYPGDLNIEKRLKGNQKKIFAFILDNPNVSLTSLKQCFGNCNNQLKALGKKGAVIVEEKEVFRRPARQEIVFREPVHILTTEQAKILKEVEKAVKEKKFFPFLLHGVTGSGKTEIYLQLMEQVLMKGRQCLYLVPEISLTPQLWDRINSRLKTVTAMLHSSLTDAERFDAWRMIRKGEVNVVIGARSAIFASFSDLGLIVVDEEHDSSYKQDEKLRYNARDLALLKGQFLNSAVVLGSATPSIESFHNAQKKKYFYGSLSNRVENRTLPDMKIIDMKQENSRKSKGIISGFLQKAIEQRLSRGEQSLLFLNRRGFSPAFLCKQCGFTFKCPNCDVSLIHHSGLNKLCCHYCGLSRRLPEECPECGSYFLTSLGWGTERLEKEVKSLFHSARIARMDSDTISAKGSVHSILKNVYSGNIDVLIGTQMVVKGLHLPNITLVGVLCADQSLNFPDYRAGERTFQLLTQVAGRAGRGDTKGEVIIQTYNPHHYCISYARQHDYISFYETEMRFRKKLGYPPYKRIINIRFEGPNRSQVETLSTRIGSIGRQLLESLGLKETVEILGPARAPWEKLKNRYRYQMLIKGKSLEQLRCLTSKVLEQSGEHVKGKGAKLIVDVDPLFMM
jgi:primosomal protein N' (replication factor Y)